jgi:hypothetical protein
VTRVLVEQPQRDLVQRGLDGGDLVRTSMQYRSSSTIPCTPRTWPSIRRRRVWSWSLVAV